MSAYPVRGVDYPGTWREFETWFASDADCAGFLEKLRWSDSFVCPRCEHTKAWRMSRGRKLVCTECELQTSVTAGTIFEKTRTPLRTWFAAIWFVTSQKHGVSALGLQRVLGFGSYQTAWSMLHKLRRAMVRPERDRLQGIIEVDETYVGGVEEDVRGRQTENKAIVVIAVELPPTGGFGRVRMGRVPDTSAKSLTRFVRENIEPGALVKTDGWSGYKSLPGHGYQHSAVSIRASGDPAHVVMPAVHRVASLLKRWWLGTHQGAVSHEHFDYYLDEYTFRFNRRSSQSRGLLFYRLLQNAVVTPPSPYHEMVGGKP